MGFAKREKTSLVANRYGSLTRSNHILARRVLNPNRHRSNFLCESQVNGSSPGWVPNKSKDVGFLARDIVVGRSVCSRPSVEVACGRFRTRTESFIRLQVTVHAANASKNATHTVIKPLSGIEISCSWERYENYFSGLLHEVCLDLTLERKPLLPPDCGAALTATQVTRRHVVQCAARKLNICRSIVAEFGIGGGAADPESGDRSGTVGMAKVEVSLGANPSKNKARALIHKLDKTCSEMNTATNKSLGDRYRLGHLPYERVFALYVNGNRKLLRQEIVRVVCRCFHFKVRSADKETCLFFDVIDIDSSGFMTLAECAMITLAHHRTTRNACHAALADSGPKLKGSRHVDIASRAAVMHINTVHQSEGVRSCAVESARHQKGDSCESSLTKRSYELGSPQVSATQKNTFTSDSAVMIFPMALRKPKTALGNLQLRLEVLWDEMMIPQRDRDYFTAAFCGDFFHKYIVTRHIKDLLHHRNRIQDALEAIKYCQVVAASLCNAFWPLTIASTSPRLRALATATQDVLCAVQKWRKDLWNCLPFHYKGSNCIHRTVDDIANIFTSALSKTHGVCTPLLKEGGYTLQDDGGLLCIIAFFVDDLDFHTLALLLPCFTNPPHNHIATALLNEAAEVAAMRQRHGRLLTKGTFTPRLRWPTYDATLLAQCAR